MSTLCNDCGVIPEHVYGKSNEREWTGSNPDAETVLAESKFDHFSSEGYRIPRLSRKNQPFYVTLIAQVKQYQQGPSVDVWPEIVCGPNEPFDRPADAAYADRLLTLESVPNDPRWVEFERVCRAQDVNLSTIMAATPGYRGEIKQQLIFHPGQHHCVAVQNISVPVSGRHQTQRDLDVTEQVFDADDGEDFGTDKWSKYSNPKVGNEWEFLPGHTPNLYPGDHVKVKIKIMPYIKQTICWRTGATTYVYGNQLKLLDVTRIHQRAAFASSTSRR